MSPHFQTALENIMLQKNNVTIILDFPPLFFFTEDVSHDGKENGSTPVRDTRFFKFYHIPISSFNLGIHQFFFDVTRLILIEVDYRASKYLKKKKGYFFCNERTLKVVL